MFERLKVLLFQKKIQTEAKDIPFFEKNSVVSRFVTLSLEIPEKSKLHPWTFHKIVSHHLEIKSQKQKSLEVPQLCLDHPSTSISCNFSFVTI